MIGDQLQAELAGRFLAYFGMVWAVVAICVGLAASELKKRPFWLWVVLSVIAGPIAWFVLFRLPIYVPPDKRVACPNCGKTMNRDSKACPHCRAWVDKESKDKAAELGKQAATMVFTARRLFGSARRAADAAAQRRTPSNGTRR